MRLISPVSLARVWPAFLWLGVAGLAAVTAWRFPAGGGAVPGPGWVPLVLATALAVLAIILHVHGRRSKPTAPASVASDQPWRTTMGLVIVVSGYAVLMPLVGFISTSALLVTAALRLLGYPHWVRAVAFGLLAGFILYGFFAGLMNVPLPGGWVG